MEPRSVVVIGASLAGLRTIEALRERGFDGAITWVGAEEEAPYDRPPLSKQFLRGEWDRDRVRLRARPNHEELRAEPRLGTRATRLEVASRSVHLDDGSHLTFDGLVIATGAAPRTLPFPVPRGVHTLRTLRDATTLREALAKRPRVAVVGAGFIGLELSASCRTLGLEVTVVEAATAPLIRLGAEMSRAVLELHASQGVHFRFGVTVEAALGSPDVQALRLSDGTLVEAEVVIVGVGVTPETGWLAGSGVAVDDGVRCDATGATSVPGIVAAGDVARWENPLYGDARRVEHWTSAAEQAHVAAARLLDANPQPLSSVPYFWSDQYDAKIQFAGRIAPGDTWHVEEGSVGTRDLVALYRREGKISGVVTVNKPGHLVRYKKAILAGGGLG